MRENTRENMSNRNSHPRPAGSKGFPKPQKVFVPKNPDHNNSIPREPNPNPTLSTSLRQSLSKQQSNPETSPAASAPPSGSRVRMGEKGEWVPSRAQGGNFVSYLPQDEAVAAGLGANEGGLDALESQRVVDLLNRELSRLLKLNPKEFWRQVASDASLHEFLDSFLQFRSRWYDFPHRGAKELVAGVIVGEFELSRRVFMVLYRISSNRDPGARLADILSPKDHEVLLQEKKLLDLPTLLDICAIYGHENEDLTRVLVGNAVKAHTRIHDNLTAVASHFLSIVQTMYQRSSSALETLFSHGNSGVHGSSRLLVDLLEKPKPKRKKNAIRKPSSFNDAISASLPCRSWSLSSSSSDFKLRPWTSVPLVDSEKERMSVVMFFVPKYEADIGPLRSLVSPQNPPLFKRIGTEKSGMTKVYPNSANANIVPSYEPYRLKSSGSDDETATVLTVWKKSLLLNCNGFTVFNPKNPYWFKRDRFVLSAGHGCMLQYALLHLAGYDSVKSQTSIHFHQVNS